VYLSRELDRPRAPLGDPDHRPESLRVMAEQGAHLGGGLEVELVGWPVAGSGQRREVARGDEDVVELVVCGSEVSNLARGK
jgi:hypothetical protein